MDNPISVDLGRVAQDLQIRRVQVESVVQLLDEGNTVPFITRYRKERTGNLNEVVIHEIQVRVQRLRELAERKATILKAIEGQGKLNDELAAAIRAAENPKRLEDLYLPFKPKKRTKASDAREKGLEPLAARVWNRDETLTDLPAAAAEFVNPEKGLETPEKVLEGVGHILAEAISEMAAVRDAVRKVVWKTGKVVTSKGEVAEGQGLEYRDYFDYSEPLSQVPPHRVLAINRGDKEGPLKLRFEVSRPDLEAAFFHQLPLEGHPQAELFRASAIDALDRLIMPSMEREVRRDLTEAAERHAVDVFARNLRSLLLQPPIPRQAVLAIDPGLRTGCKVAVLDPQGNLLDQTVIYPHAPQNRRSEAKVTLKDLVGKHGVSVVAIGNGTACRETEELIAEIIAEGTEFSQQAEAGGAAPEAAAEHSPAHEAAAAEHSPAHEEAVAEHSPATATSEHAAPEPAAAEAHAEAPAGTTPEEPAPAAPEAAVAEPPSNGEAPHPAEPGADGDGHAPDASTTLGDESLPPILGGAPDTEPAEQEATAKAHDEPHHGDQPPQPEPAAEGSLTPPHLPEPNEPQHVEAVSEMVAEGSPVATPAPVEAGPEAAREPEPAAAEGGAHAPEAAGEPASDPSGGEPAPAPAAAEAAVESPDHEAHSEPAAADAGTPAEGAEAPAAQPASAATRGEGRRGGKDQNRSRGQRNRASSPPPPQTPPAPHPADRQLAQLAYVIVNEAGASVYSTSQVGREELPEFDATLRSAISIGRRLQDPLAELVKIEPQNIGVGLYQHDVNPKQLKETLDSVISSCVNFVGVDLNTASVPLLRHVSGLNSLTARRIVDRRKEKGRFNGREELLEVEGVGPASFTQAAGFLKVAGGTHPLDRTWVHPESYEAAAKLLERFGFTPDVVGQKERLPELHEKLAEVNTADLSRELGLGEPTLKDIIEALGRPERDPRDDLPKPIFKKGILKIEDLTPGMELKGTVLNVVDFGAFVDVGLKDSGLVHISQLANRYIKSPHDVVSVGDVVTVWVMSVDQERKRVSLTMVKPGTERQRGGQGGPRRGGGEPREGQGQGQGRRDRGRGPRPSGSTLTAPPVGAAPITALNEGAPRREGPGGSDAGHGERHGHGPGPGGRPPGPGRGGQGARGGAFGRSGGGPGPGRPDTRPQAPRPPARPPRPSAPPPPLSKDALAGKAPVRSFGQLKQLWEARDSTDGDPSAPPGTNPAEAPEAPPSSQAETPPPPPGETPPDAPQG
ncbi:30S ribosomal protein S1 [Aquisphaera giovannonii]|uniref:30S ribosomal protein S1 n=1 Tax=Aquisphaera giovannonii TaxID=406548 RepID=A0A5B9VXF7_9BACT|nr:Tex-like N-terminal domain-containing protein [Aquisphaera giovannonii]QEH32551.1 30S ribosomal protein S1 [Aquisphaera giovannonii]